MNKLTSTTTLMLLMSVALLLLSIMPFTIDAAFHDSQRLISLCILTAFLLMGLLTVKVSLKALCLVGGLAVWGGIIALSSNELLWSTIEYLLLFNFFLLGLILFQQIQWQHLLGVAWLFVALQGFYIVRNVTYYSLTIVSGDKMDAHSLINGFSNVRFYGHFLIWTTPFVLSILLIEKHTKRYFFALMIVMFGGAFELLTGTRAFWVAMLATVPASWWFARHICLAYTNLIVIFIVGSVVIYGLMVFVLPWLVNYDAEGLLKNSLERDLTSSSGRIELWVIAIRSILSEPWLGIGPMMMASVDLSPKSAHPHNYLLQLGAEWGVPFTLMLIVISMRATFVWRQTISEHWQAREIMALPVATSLAGASIAGLVSGLLVMPVSLVYMSLMLGLAVGLWRTWTSNASRSLLPKWFVGVCMIPSIALLLFAWQSYPGHLEECQLLDRYGLSDPKRPRFWTFGKIASDPSDSALCPVDSIEN